MKFDETLFPAKEATKSQTSLNDLPISHSDNESETSGAELVIPPQSPKRPPIPGRSATPTQPPSQLVAGPSSQPSMLSEQPAHSSIPDPRYSIRSTKAQAARSAQTSGNSKR